MTLDRDIERMASQLIEIIDIRVEALMNKNDRIAHLETTMCEVVQQIAELKGSAVTHAPVKPYIGQCECTLLGWRCEKFQHAADVVHTTHVVNLGRLKQIWWES